VIAVEISNEYSQRPLDERRAEAAVRSALEEARSAVTDGRISLAVVDDATIARLHEEYLQQSDPTDVLSFALEQGEGCLEGEVVVSAETAARRAPEFGFEAEDELLLYVVHGCLHLVGYDDASPEQRAEMRRREQSALKRLGIESRREESGVVSEDIVSGGNHFS